MQKSIINNYHCDNDNYHDNRIRKQQYTVLLDGYSAIKILIAVTQD